MRDGGADRPSRMMVAMVAQASQSGTEAMTGRKLMLIWRQVCSKCAYVSLVAFDGLGSVLTVPLPTYR
jgi:hypothetical protein